MGLLQKEVEEQNRQREDFKMMMVGRMETLTYSTTGEGTEDKLNELRVSMVVVTDTLGDKLQSLEDMALAVPTMVEEAVGKLANGMEDQKSDQ